MFSTGDGDGDFGFCFGFGFSMSDADEFTVPLTQSLRTAALANGLTDVAEAIRMYITQTQTQTQIQIQIQEMENGKWKIGEMILRVPTC